MSLKHLKQELSKPARSRAEVIYIMVETRKMLEHYELASKYKDLMFFCNWTLHPKLTRFNTIKPIIEEF